MRFDHKARSLSRWQGRFAGVFTCNKKQPYFGKSSQYYQTNQTETSVGLFDHWNSKFHIVASNAKLVTINQLAT
jgi:hypothetical protein